MEWIFGALVAWAIWAYVTQKAPASKTPPPTRKHAAQPTLRITYEDAEGQTTVRDVTPKSRATNERFYAWCHLRNEPREFVFSRVLSGVDLATGEVLDRVGVFRHIHPKRKPPPGLS